MKSAAAFALLVVTAIGGLWLSRPEKAPPLETVSFTPALNRTQETGRRIYLRRCAWCHGNQRDGFGLNATKLETPPPDFTAPQFRSAAGKAAVIAWLDDQRPRPGVLCPSWKETLSPAERDALAEYVAMAVE